MKATHIGEVADLEHIVRSSDPSMQFSAHQVGFILDYEDQEIELFKESVSLCYTEVNTDFIFRDYMLTNIREIKPVIEIPETPFWATQAGSVFKLIENHSGFEIFMGGNSFLRRIDSQEIQELLREGTWIICDEPKKVIDIPETPFWFTHRGNIFELRDWTNFNHSAIIFENGCRMTNQYSKNDTSKYLNNGAWTICDEPEKKMRPFTDDDWKEWFLNDGKVIDNRGADDEDYENTVYLMIHGLTPDDEDQFYYMGEGDWLPKSTFIIEFLDRHGNKFEKEA